MVAGLEKDILRGREFAQGDVWRKMKARQTGPLKGIHRGGEVSSGNVRRQTGVIPSEEARAVLEVSPEG